MRRFNFLFVSSINELNAFEEILSLTVYVKEALIWIH